MRALQVFSLLLVGIGLGAGGAVWADSLTRLAKPHAAPAESVVVKDTATSTEYAARFEETPIGGDYAAQGGCLKIADSDGSGFTYITANNGLLSVSPIGCGR